MQATTRTPLTDIGPAWVQRRTVALGLWIVVALAVFALDQGSKAWAERTLTAGVPRPLLGSWLQLHLTYNAGAAFSLGTSYTIGLSLIALGVIAVCLRISRRLGSLGWATALGLLLGGALGNVTDRLFRSPGPFRGNVVDFLQVPHWPVFNAADSAISTAAVIFIVLTLRGVHLDGSVDGTGTNAAEASAEQ